MLFVVLVSVVLIFLLLPSVSVPVVVSSSVVTSAIFYGRDRHKNRYLAPLWLTLVSFSSSLTFWYKHSLKVQPLARTHTVHNTTGSLAQHVRPHVHWWDSSRSLLGFLRTLTQHVLCAAARTVLANLDELLPVSFPEQPEGRNGVRIISYLVCA